MSSSNFVQCWHTAAATVGLLMTACHHGNELPIRHQHALFFGETRLLLIEPRQAPAGSPARGSEVVAYEVAQERVLWRTGVSDDYIAPSPSRLVASVLSHSDGQRSHLGLLDLTTGKFRLLDIRPPDPHGRAAQKDKASISDDGALFASVMDGQLGVWSTLTTQLLHQQRFGDEYPMTVEFLRGSHDLTVELLAMPATNENPPSLAVLARDGDAWRLEQSFEQVRGFGWTKRGLLLSTAAGISRYDRREVRLLVEPRGKARIYDVGKL